MSTNENICNIYIFFVNFQLNTDLLIINRIQKVAIFIEKKNKKKKRNIEKKKKKKKLNKTKKK